MKNLDAYVGRIVKLNNDVFQAITRRPRRHGVVVDNCFIVAGVSPGMRKLICYGADVRVAVGIAEVALI